MPSSILNSDDGVISGTAGLKNSGGDDGVLVFQSKGTDTAKLETNGDFAINAGFGSVGKAFLCRAWVNFDGTTNVGGNCTIRASGNVSSISDNGPGDYTVNFTTAMPDANYVAVALCNRNAASLRLALGHDGGTTSGFQVSTRDSIYNFADSPGVLVSFFR